MGTCGGTRIDHLDGSLAACSQELLGRVCTGGEHSARATCEDVLGRGGCELCEAVFHAESLLRDVVAGQLASPTGVRHRPGTVRSHAGFRRPAG